MHQRWNLYEEIRTSIEGRALTSDEGTFVRFASAAVFQNHNLIILNPSNDIPEVLGCEMPITRIDLGDIESLARILDVSLVSTDVRYIDKVGHQLIAELTVGNEIVSVPYYLEGLDAIFDENAIFDPEKHDLLTRLVVILRKFSRLIMPIKNPETLTRINQMLARLKSTNGLDGSYSDLDRLQAHVSVIFRTGYIQIEYAKELGEYRYDFSELEG